MPTAPTDDAPTDADALLYAHLSLPSAASAASVAKQQQQPPTLHHPKQKKQKKLRVLLIVAAWFSVSIALHVFNKWLFSRDLNNFPFPILTTAAHALVQLGLSLVTIRCFAPALAPARPPPLPALILRILPCGIATALDIGLSNSALKSISLSFYTMVKSGVPVFVLLFAFLLGIERPTISMLAVVVIIVAGVWIMVANESKFDAVGYSHAQLATAFAGLRWALTQILLKSPLIGINNPLATNLFLTPVVAVSLVITSICIEDGFPALLASPHFATTSSSLTLLAIIASGGCIAFFLILLEYSLVVETSVVTLSIAGIFKEIITIAISAIVFGDRFSGNVALGLVVSLIGIAGYNYLRALHGSGIPYPDHNSHTASPPISPSSIIPLSIIDRRSTSNHDGLLWQALGTEDDIASFHANVDNDHIDRVSDISDSDSSLFNTKSTLSPNNDNDHTRNPPRLHSNSRAQGYLDDLMQLFGYI